MPSRRACAKINFYLRVHGTRPDGYHRITTVMMPLPDLADEVVVDNGAAGVHLQCSPSDLAAGEENLCVRAARAFSEAAGVVPAWQMRLEKRIPVAAGLGGGSSDAAAVLTLLNAMHDEALNPPRLHEVATRLGADVPFFLDAQAAVATGIGDQLDPFSPAVPFGLVLANPGFPVPARWAYRHWAGVARPPPPDVAELVRTLRSGTPDKLAALLHNDLEYCVFRKFPMLDMVREAMLDAGCLAVHCSGSGPTLYGICEPADTPDVHRRVRDTVDESVWTCHTVL